MSRPATNEVQGSTCSAVRLGHHAPRDVPATARRATPAPADEIWPDRAARPARGRGRIQPLALRRRRGTALRTTPDSQGHLHRSGHGGVLAGQPLLDFPSLSTLSSTCLLYTSPSPRDGLLSRMPSSA